VQTIASGVWNNVELLACLLGGQWCREADAYIGRFLELQAQIRKKKRINQAPAGSLQCAVQQLNPMGIVLLGG
jgi:hypothetical protein